MHPANFDHFEFHTRIDFEITQNDITDTLSDEEIEESDNEEDSSAENSPFTTVIDENGMELVVRKSTLVWMLSERGAAISKDRLRRVQVSTASN